MKLLKLLQKLIKTSKIYTEILGGKFVQMNIKQIMEFIIKVIKGMIVGLGAITAGAGTFAIVLGIYDKCMQIIAKPFKNFTENLKYIAPIVLGIGISILIFKSAVIYLFTNYTPYIKCIFFGIILGGIPALLKVANKEGKNKKYNIASAVAFIITIILTIIGKQFGKLAPMETKMDFILLIIYGIIYGFGAIMPGMTTMHMLIFLGVWGQILKGIFSLDMNIIIPFAIGYIIVVLLTANLISYCFKKYYGYTYYAIIGFSITSLLMLIPNVNKMSQAIICILITLGTGILMYKITKLEDKIKEKENRILEVNQNV